MTFEDRQRFKELLETVKALRERLEDEEAEFSREEATQENVGAAMMSDVNGRPSEGGDATPVAKASA